MATDIHIGAYFERPDGAIAYTTGTCENRISYYLTDYDGPYSADLDEYATWKYRPDLKDWPDTKNPILPYAFDLHFDIKRLNELKDMLEHHEAERSLIRDLVGRYANECPALVPLVEQYGIDSNYQESDDE